MNVSFSYLSQTWVITSSLRYEAKESLYYVHTFAICQNFGAHKIVLCSVSVIWVSCVMLHCSISHDYTCAYPPSHTTSVIVQDHAAISQLNHRDLAQLNQILNFIHDYCLYLFNLVDLGKLSGLKRSFVYIFDSLLWLSFLWGVWTFILSQCIH